MTVYNLGEEEYGLEPRIVFILTWVPRTLKTFRMERFGNPG